MGWLVNPCLAIALLPPAIAALHGIVLAVVHVDGKLLNLSPRPRFQTDS